MGYLGLTAEPRKSNTMYGVGGDRKTPCRIEFLSLLMDESVAHDGVRGGESIMRKK